MRYLLITLLVCTGASVLYAQQSTTFLASIQYYESTEGAKFSYDPAIFSHIRQSFDATLSLDEFISTAESQLPIKIQKVGENYYTVILVESEYVLSLSDSLASKALEPPFFFLINSVPVDIKLDGRKAVFRYKPQMEDTLIVYVPGFEKKLIDNQQMLNSKSLAVALMTQTYLMNDVVVESYVTKGINLDPNNQKITIDVADLPLLPGETDGDIFASLAALPGITTPDGRPGNLFIRGTSPDQSLILFDNIPMYHRGHYFGTISPYNPKVVNNVEVHRSGYHPRMGGRVGGAVFINSEEEVSNDPQFGIGANTLYAMAYAKTPLANNKIGLVLGARHSYPPSISSPKLDAITESVFAATGISDDEGNIGTDVRVKFQDYHAKLILKPNEKHKITISGIYSDSDLSYELIQAGPQGGDEHLDFENYGVNTEWSFDINQDWSASLTNTLGQFTYFTESPVPMGQRTTDNSIQDYNARLEFSRANRRSNQIQFGIDYKLQSSTLDYNDITSNITSGVTESVIRNDKVEAHTISPFANMNWYSQKLNIQTGLRGGYYSPKQNFYLSPRISANYTINSSIDIKASAGRYHQFLSQVRNLQIGTGGFDNALWQLASDDQGEVISGTQFMTGVMINKNRWLFDVEAFYKTANNVTYYESLFLDNSSGFFSADNVLYGADSYLRREMSESTSMWVGYSYGGSKITLDTTNQTTYKSKYVQPHVFYLGGAYQKNRWKFSGVWKYGSGLNAQSLEIAYVQVIYERAQNNRPPGAPRAPDPFADVPERYPNVHSLDVSASYKIPKTDQRPWSASFGLSVINVFDQDNLIDRAFRGNPPPPKWIDRNALGFAPNLMVTFEW
ncbi:MAG: TonB-dependent receptor plug domain-containing protein [Reichenbachiella sp.]|uniref:TonB-dependent receptor plug domain-containing protein n=3 Tax=Reichenbachiella sp. TaxID=2184521 RepID=UPI003299CD8E